MATTPEDILAAVENRKDELKAVFGKNSINEKELEVIVKIIEDLINQE